MRKYLRFGRFGVCFYTHRFIPKPFGGYAYGPVCFIKPQYRGSDGLFQHEMCHTRQFWKGVLTLGLGWPSKLERELEAYTVQLRCYPNEKRLERLNLFSGWIADRYGLSIKWTDARAMLAKRLLDG